MHLIVITILNGQPLLAVTWLFPEADYLLEVWLNSFYLDPTLLPALQVDQLNIQISAVVCLEVACQLSKLGLESPNPASQIKYKTSAKLSNIHPMTRHCCKIKMSKIFLDWGWIFLVSFLIMTMFISCNAQSNMI